PRRAPRRPRRGPGDREAPQPPLPRPLPLLLLPPLPEGRPPLRRRPRSLPVPPQLPQRVQDPRGARGFDAPCRARRRARLQPVGWVGGGARSSQARARSRSIGRPGHSPALEGRGTLARRRKPLDPAVDIRQAPEGRRELGEPGGLTE